jgi:hypothetical protein
MTMIPNPPTSNHPALRIAGFVQAAPQVRAQAQNLHQAGINHIGVVLTFAVLADGPGCGMVHIAQPYPSHDAAQQAAQRYKKGSYVQFDIPAIGLHLHVNGVANLQRLPDPTGTSLADSAAAEPELFA